MFCWKFQPEFQPHSAKRAQKIHGGRFRWCWCSGIVRQCQTAVVLSFLVVSVLQMNVCQSKIHDDNSIEDDKPDFYSFTALDTNGTEVSLGQYRGKVSLVVNTASQCGFSEAHFKSLTRLQDIMSFSGHFNVLAFPCNQFGRQEPLEGSDIRDYLLEQYGAEFEIFDKIDVIGEQAHPAFKNLIDQTSIYPDWNFYKYLVDHNGISSKAWGPSTTVEEIYDDVKVAVEEARKAEGYTGEELEYIGETIERDEL